ncbi:MAG: hypothetical protein J3K34DRAFT_432466 [Monoraphidium minutum]|nr:MAG: hypothetical protein J3K34DRAFT_432466 [Monoraphidium minutum]
MASHTARPVALPLRSALGWGNVGGTGRQQRGRREGRAGANYVRALHALVCHRVRLESSCGCFTSGRFTSGAWAGRRQTRGPPRAPAPSPPPAACSPSCGSAKPPSGTRRRSSVLCAHAVGGRKVLEQRVQLIRLLDKRVHARARPHGALAAREDRPRRLVAQRGAVEHGALGVRRLDALFVVAERHPRVELVEARQPRAPVALGLARQRLDHAKPHQPLRLHQRRVCFRARRGLPHDVKRPVQQAEHGPVQFARREGCAEALQLLAQALAARVVAQPVRRSFQERARQAGAAMRQRHKARDGGGRDVSQAPAAARARSAGRREKGGAAARRVGRRKRLEQRAHARHRAAGE